MVLAIDKMKDDKLLGYAQQLRKQYIGLHQILSIVEGEIESRIGIPKEMMDRRAEATSNFFHINKKHIEYFGELIEEKNDGNS